MSASKERLWAGFLSRGIAGPRSMLEHDDENAFAALYVNCSYRARL